MLVELLDDYNQRQLVLKLESIFALFKAHFKYAISTERYQWKPVTQYNIASCNEILL